MPDRLSPITEPFAVADCFVAELSRIDHIGGGCFRFTWTAPCVGPDGCQERMVVAKLVMHESSVPAAIGATLKQMGITAEILPGLRDGMH